MVKKEKQNRFSKHLFIALTIAICFLKHNILTKEINQNNDDEYYNIDL